MIKDVTILTGFLGAGKTTLLNAIIAANKQIRYAIIENEFGQESIDSQLVLAPAADVIELNDGCLCCSLSGALIEALDTLIKTDQPWDELVIECTGIADPANIASPFLLEPAVKNFFTLKRVICVVDAQFIEDQLKETQEAIRQISFADTLLINQSGNISPGYLHILKNILQTINPFAVIMVDENDQLPLDELMLRQRAVDFNANPRPILTPKGMLSLIPLKMEGNNGNTFVQSSHRVHQHSEIETITLRFSIPMDMEELSQRLRMFLYVQAAGVYRIKGIVYAEGHDHKIIVQSVGERLFIAEGDFWEAGNSRETRIVIIGKQLQLKGFEKMFTSCLTGTL